VSDTQAYKQFGNSVAVPVIKELAKRVIKEIEKMKEHKKTYQPIDIDKIIFENVHSLSKV